MEPSPKETATLDFPPEQCRYCLTDGGGTQEQAILRPPSYADSILALFRRKIKGWSQSLRLWWLDFIPLTPNLGTDIAP